MRIPVVLAFCLVRAESFSGYCIDPTKHFGFLTSAVYSEMSEHSGEQLSRGSSLSLLSGFGTSTLSGTSDSGHINLDELSDDRLESLIDETKAALRLLILETLMFESYHERLVSGQVREREISPVIRATL